MHFLDAVQRWAVAALVLLCLALSWAADHYRKQVTARDAELGRLSAAIERQNAQAAQTLATLTAQRDAAQARLNILFQQQETADAAAQQEIDRLRNDLEQRPVRVRLVPQSADSRGSGSGAAGNACAAAHVGTADAAQTHGLLPAGNSQRLGAVIAEVETINAAYASCRARLMREGSNP